MVEISIIRGVKCATCISYRVLWSGCFILCLIIVCTFEGLHGDISGKGRRYISDLNILFTQRLRT